MATKKQVLEYLEELGINADTDKILVDELYYILKQIKKVKVEIEKYTVKTYRNGAKANPAFDIYLKLVNRLQVLCTKLNMTPQERVKGKLQKDSDADQLAFAEFMNSQPKELPSHVENKD